MGDLIISGLLAAIDLHIKQVDLLPDAEKIDAINEIKKKLHEISPFKSEPVDCVLWVHADRVQANDYNPNTVASPEMNLLEHSISSDGYTQPVVTWHENDKFEVIDGFHRSACGKRSKKVQKRVHGYLPITVANHARIDRKDRIASTIRHNRARGKHRVDAMSEIVQELHLKGWSGERISKELGMGMDEVSRLRAVTGLGAMFENAEFSQAWEMVEET